MQRKKVVFFFPAFSSQEATAPLGILAVSTPLLNAGYQVKIIDSTITPNFQRQVIEELKDAICLAVSLVTGPMIRETVQIAREVKRLYPSMPIVLGGWHPSLLPDQTLAAEYIDAVVVGQGEEALLDVVRRLEAGESLEGIPGVGFKEDGRIRFNPARALRPLRKCRRRPITWPISTPISGSVGGAGRCTRRASPARTTAAIAPMTASTAASGMRWIRTKWWKRPPTW
jgi:anaerobic magnesium-protoporphyrin IX monomethyl ester cyclase